MVHTQRFRLFPERTLFHPGKHPQSGFTLIELMVTVAIIALISGMVLSELNSSSYRLQSTARNLKTAIQRGRIEAIKRNKSVVVDFDYDGDGTADNYGYVIYDSDGNILGRYKYREIEIIPPGSGFLVFTPTGTCRPDIDIKLRPAGRNSPEYTLTTHATGSIEIAKSS